MSQAIHHAEVDGVPVLFAHHPGPVRAGLIFRVGVADETLGRTGLTHLVEHLALHRQGLADYHFNGATKAAFTHFQVQGTEPEVVAYLHNVCVCLTNLPMERLETEKEILRAEEAGREASQLPMWRYGARGYGLASYPEFGVPQLRSDDVRQWAESWFTSDNAVLWIAGERIPAGLALRLPRGRRRPMPTVTSALPECPAYFSDGTGGILLDAVVGDRSAARLYAGVLGRALFRALRQEGGYSYTATAGYGSRRDGFALVTAFADALPEKQDAVLGEFVDVLAGFQVGRIEQADLDAVRAHADAALTAPDAAAQRLPAAAELLLAGRPPHGLDQLRAELWAATLPDLHAVAREAADTALAQVPRGERLDWAGFAPAPVHSSYAVEGRHFAAASGDGTTLVVGREGVSLVGNGGPATVLYRACAARLGWPDGGRRLIGDDGLSVPVEPELYGVDPQTLAGIDAAVPPSSVVWLPPRQARPRPAIAAVPRSEKGRPGNSRRGATSPAARTRGQTAVMVGFGVIAGLWSCLALLMTVVGADDPQTTTGEWIVISVFSWLVAAALAWPAWRILRRTRPAAVAHGG
jgi:predicted Zn-dependent peptidase